MKYLLFAFIVSLSFNAPEWLTNFETAKIEATQAKKQILLNFCGSDWCAPCIRMKKEIFESDTFVGYAKANLVLVKADFPRKKNALDKKQVTHNEMLAEKYNPEGKFPFTVLLDAEGKILKSWDGMPKEAPEAFIDAIEKSRYGTGRAV
jgi:thioredoxin-related protein